MFIKTTAKIIRPFLWLMDFLTPVGDLLARCWVAYIFFKAGLLKLHSWDGTLALFNYEYHVPLLPPDFAAVLGTGAELILPVLLLIGLGGRITIFIFFVYNLVAVISYPFLWSPDGAQGLAQHVNWGLLLMLLMFHGSGKLSVDYWLRTRYHHHLGRTKT